MTLEELTEKVALLEADLAALRTEVQPVVDSHKPNPPDLPPPLAMSAVLPEK